MRLSIIIPITLALLVGCKAASEVAPPNANLTEAEKKAAEVESKIVKAKPGDAMSLVKLPGIQAPACYFDVVKIAQPPLYLWCILRTNMRPHRAQNQADAAVFDHLVIHKKYVFANPPMYCW